jgi:hypothetical protein
MCLNLCSKAFIYTYSCSIAYGIHVVSCYSRNSLYSLYYCSVGTVSPPRTVQYSTWTTQTISFFTPQCPSVSPQASQSPDKPSIIPVLLSSGDKASNKTSQFSTHPFSSPFPVPFPFPSRIASEREPIPSTLPFWKTLTPRKKAPATRRLRRLITSTYFYSAMICPGKPRNQIRKTRYGVLCMHLFLLYL